MKASAVDLRTGLLNLTEDFREIGHSGGKITLDIKSDEEGRRGYQTGFRSSRPVPIVLTAIYALPQGIPVASMNLGGIGETSNPPPFPGCLSVFIASDSEGKFGHNCPSCNSYWRSGPWPSVCPYCATVAEGYQFLSEAQLRYVRRYCDVLTDALESVKDDTIVIDMDAVAEAVGAEGEKPAFYVSEKSQQCKFTCETCGEFNDILGRFGYCSSCGTRNDLVEFELKTVPTIRERLNGEHAPEDCLRAAVASFDSFIGQFAKQLAELVPLTNNRRTRLIKQRFHNLRELCEIFHGWFDIDVRAGMKDTEFNSVAIMFHRRHVYEYNGGEVDQKYLDDSGDITVQLKQHIRESKEGVHNFLASLVKMARNIHGTFHEIFPPKPEPIKYFEENNARMAKYTNSQN